MRTSWSSVSISGLAALLAACGGGRADGELKISRSTALEFEATYIAPGGEWARVQRVMGHRATKELLETSSGNVYVNDGLGLADTTRPTGVRQVDTGSPDEALLQGMLSAFLDAGVNPSPSDEEQGTPFYAAAYVVVEALGVPRVRLAFGEARDMFSEEPPRIFPYAGWNSASLVPREADEVIAGEQNGSGICSSAPVSYCCGDMNCWGCDPQKYPGGCAPACAAGDHCHKFHEGSGCGDTVCGTWQNGVGCGTPGDNFCPHTCGDRGTVNQQGLAQYQNNVCNKPRLQWETSYCYYHTPVTSGGNTYNYACEPWNCGVLFKGERLNQGQSLYSCDGRFRLTMQGDGNAVLYQGSVALWATGTNGRGGCYITQQTDGNLVVYNCSAQPLWASGTNGYGGAWARVQEDGNFVIYYPWNSLGVQGLDVKWASNTCCH